MRNGSSWGAAALVLCMAVAAAPAGLAQDADGLAEVRREIEALRRGQEAIRDDIRAIRELLERSGPSARAAAAPGPVEEVDLELTGIGDDPVKGDAGAGLMLVEFTDYQCPFCRRHFETTAPQIEREYVQGGRLGYVVRDFPLTSIHPHAFKAAEAANCAGEQGKYWEMHDRLFANARELAPEHMRGHAEAVGLDPAEFADCFVSGRQAGEVRRDIADGGRAGVSGTPTFFLAVPGDEPGTARAVAKIRGAQPFAVFQRVIDEHLAELERRAAAEAGG